MRNFEIQAKFDKGVKTLRITQPTGSGDSYQILIDNYYQGNLLRHQGKWIGHLNDKSNITKRNIETIGKLIEERFGIEV